MLFQPSNISPSTLSGIGAGTVDVTLGVTVSWQVNGDTPMTAYQITIYQNDSASTQKYTTGKITLSQPFQPHDKNGNPQFFSTQISAANLSSAGVVNGYANGYKLLITQWWSANDYVTQTSASVFNTLQNPTLTIDTISGTSISETITATYSQAQGDPISTVEWIFAVAGSESDPIKQTGTVTTQILSFDVDGLMDGTTYSIECNVVTASGVYISTGFVQFTVSYSITTETLLYTLGQVNGTSGVYLSWDAMSATPITGYEVYRKESDIPYLKHVATTSSNLREVVDYAVASQATVKYVIISMNGTTQKSIGETSEITPVFWDYSILLCYTDADGYYHVNQEFRFGLSVETGAISNGNEPTMQLNFTKYPNRQPMASLYKSGTLKSYIGSSDSAYQYHDSISLQDAIYAISTSRLTKFYKNRKGDVLMVDTNAAISMQTMDNSPKQAMQATINWSEVGEARGESIISQPSDAFFPVTVTYVYEEVRGSVASFVSKYANEPLKSLTATINPMQSFNGYSEPWAAGAGTNKACWPTLSNTSSNGVDYSITDDGNTLVIYGTATSQSSGAYSASVTYANMPFGPFPAGWYTIKATGFVGQNVNDRITINAKYSNGSNVGITNTRISGPSATIPDGTGRTLTFEATQEFKFSYYISISSGTTIDCSVKVQFEEGDTLSEWSPYANVCPITGWAGANITRTGINFAKNIRKGTTVQGGSTKTFTFADDGSFTVASSGGTSTTTSSIGLAFTTNYYGNQSAELYVLPDLFVLKAGKTYTVRDCAISAFTGDADTRTEIGDYLYADAHRNTQITPTSDMHVKQVRIFYRPSIQNDSNFVYEPMVFEGTAADYEPFGEVYSADWTSAAGTVYAGSYDAVSGKLKARPQYASYNGETLVGPWLSSMDVYEEGVTPTTGAQVVDLGGTETEHTLTAQQVNAMMGQNNVWADTGDVDVEYLKDKVISKK